jgi:hypothetical protein
MARSRPRKAAKDKAAKERREQQLETQARKAEYLQLWDLAHEISGDNPPDIEASGRSPEEIEQWFEDDPAAPVLLFQFPPAEADGCIPGRQVRISVNARGIERELRSRGIDEQHPHWERAFNLTQDTILEVAQRTARAGFGGGA